MVKIQARKICIIRLSALGDAVHTLSFVNGLRQGYPDSHITWITQGKPYEMMKNQPSINRFIIFRKKMGFRNLCEFYLKTLREESYDLLIIPQVSFKASLLTMFIRADIKLGFDYKRSRELHWFFLNRSIPKKPPQHTQRQYFEFLEYLGIDDYSPRWDFIFTSSEHQWQQDFFRTIGQPVLTFVVASSTPKKDWAPECYTEVIDYVEKKLPLKCMLFGGLSQREQELKEKILSACKSKPVLAFESDIRKGMLQLEGSTMVVSPDTGPLHMAVAMNVPTVGLYGYSNPQRCGPFEKYQDLLISTQSINGNSPNLRSTRENGMSEITPSEVIDKISYGLHRYCPELIPANPTDKYI